MIKQILKYLKVSFVVGIGEFAPMNARESQVIPAVLVGFQSRFDVPNNVFLPAPGGQNRDILRPGCVLNVSISNTDLLLFPSDISV